MIKSRASQDRINEILNLDEVVVDVPNATGISRFNKQLVFKNVSFQYESELILEEISFAIEKGQNIAIVGESGSGKTTLINLIPRFYNVSSGSIEIDGQKINELRIKDLRSTMSLVSQDPIFIQLKCG